MWHSAADLGHGGLSIPVAAAKGFGVYRDRPCLAHSGQEGSGPRCLNDEGDLELEIQ